jgi:hypothetical protein
LGWPTFFYSSLSEFVVSCEATAVGGSTKEVVMDGLTASVVIPLAVLVGIILAVLLLAVLRRGPSILSGYSGNIEEVIAESDRLRQSEQGGK